MRLIFASCFQLLEARRVKIKLVRDNGRLELGFNQPYVWRRDHGLCGHERSLSLTEMLDKCYVLWWHSVPGTGSQHSIIDCIRVSSTVLSSQDRNAYRYR